MKTLIHYLFSRVLFPLRRAALAAVPLVLLGLMASPGHASISFAPAPAFNPATPTYGSDAYFSYTSGTIAGAAETPGGNGVTGISYTGGPVTFTQQASGFAVTSSLTEFSISGTGNSGALSASSDMVSVRYHFTLAGSAGNIDPPLIESFTLALSATTSMGMTTSSVTGTETVSGDFSGTAVFALSGADSGATLTGYTASLTVNYELISINGATLSVTVPTGSIDFDAVPEPGTWATLAFGLGAVGVRWTRVRRRRAA